MPESKRDDILIAVALTRFSVQFEDTDPELSEHAWQLAADLLLEYNVEPAETVEVLENTDDCDTKSVLQIQGSFRVYQKDGNSPTYMTSHSDSIYILQR